MPVGILVNGTAIIIGGLIGTAVGPKISESLKVNLNSIFGVCALTMGISSIGQMVNMPAVILAVILGTVIGFAVHLGQKIQTGGLLMQKWISALLPGDQDRTPEYKSLLVTAIVLFCASGTGIYGSIVSGMTGDHRILLAKSILDLPTALIFACTLGAVTSFIAIPQMIIFLMLFALAKVIFPFCTPEMIGDFKACGGVLLLATGFRMMKVKEFPIADMIPAMVLIMPLSRLWMSIM